MTKCHFVPHEGSTTQCDARARGERSDGGSGYFHHLISLLLHFSLSLRLAFAFSVVRSERLLQRQRGLHWDSAFFATFA